MSYRLTAILVLSLLVLAALLPFTPARVLAGSLPQVVPTLNGTPPPVFTPGPFTPFPTNTPRADGSIVHEVQPGEAMWSIAISYGTTIEEILALNGLPPGSTAIFAGQKLLIRMGTPGVLATTVAQATEGGTATPGTPAESVTVETEAPRQPSATHRPTSTRPPTSTPRPTRTPGLQPSATIAPAANPGWLPDNRTLGMILVGVGVVGLLVVLIAGFRR